MDTPLWVPRPGEKCFREFTPRIRRNRTGGAETNNRTTITINTDDEDRHGTIIEPEAARLDNYDQNPVVLINHMRSLVAGTSAVSLRNGQLVANMEDEDWDLDDPDIERWFNKVKNGIIRAASIGFRSHEVEKELIDPDGDPYDYSNVRYRITDWELLEWSYVSVPSNPGALVTERSMRGAGSGEQFMMHFQELERKVDTILEQLPAGTSEPADPEQAAQAASEEPEEPNRGESGDEDPAEAAPDASSEAAPAEDAGSAEPVRVAPELIQRVKEMRLREEREKRKGQLKHILKNEIKRLRGQI